MVHMKKTLIIPSKENYVYSLTEQGKVLRIPTRVADKYLVTKSSLKDKAKKAIRSAQVVDLENMVDAKSVFKEMDEKYTRAGALLRGTRHREGLSQLAFAKKIEIKGIYQKWKMVNVLSAKS